jgi:cytidylate kinase
MIPPTTTLLERQAEALERAERHRETRRRPAEVPAPVLDWAVALSREAGTPGTSVAREVGDRLGWAVYDHELLERIAQEMGLRTALLEGIDERRQSWLTECLEALAAEKQVTETGYVHRLTEVLFSLALHGRCVIVGRGAPHVLPARTTLRVRLVGDKNDRIAAAAQRFCRTPQEAARWVDKTDRDRSEFVQDHFNRDPTDPRNYDLVLNTSRWSVAECADFIVLALHHLDTRRDGRSPARSV